jgi:acetyl-CoA carboxylase biotin carboxyl carrier protein
VLNKKPTFMDFKQIQELIRQVSKAGVSEVKIEQGDFKITIKTKGSEYVTVATPMPPVMQQPVAVPVAAAPQVVAETKPAEAKTAETSTDATAADNAKLVTVKSPMIGTFYRSPGPDKEPFVKVGDIVSKGDVLCIIEAMKLFNEIESEFEGKIIKFLVEDASPVEYDQPLFLIEKA